MKIVNVDIAIVGAGSAGMSAYKSALKHTSKILVIESGPYGTTCARVGCMPSKLLIAAAEAAHSVEFAQAFGVNVEAMHLDGTAVMERVRRERDRFVGFSVETVESWPEEHRLRGHARFLDDRTLQVDDHTHVVAQRIILATGSHNYVPQEWRRSIGDRLIVNDDVFSWEKLPKSVAVLGAGVVALELCQALSRLGVRVRMYGRGNRIGPLSDPALQALTLQIFDNELPLRMRAKDVSLTRDGDEVIVRSGNDAERFEYVLAASGRKPNLDRLDLLKTSLPIDENGCLVFDPETGRVGESNVFVAGDITNELTVLHEAVDLGRIAGENAGRYPNTKHTTRRTPMTIVFSDPQIMMVGKTHEELIESKSDFSIGTVSFANQGRSRVMLKNRGALHLYAENSTGRLLGAEMVGPSAEHIYAVS